MLVLSRATSGSALFWEVSSPLRRDPTRRKAYVTIIRRRKRRGFPMCIYIHMYIALRPIINSFPRAHDFAAPSTSTSSTNTTPAAAAGCFFPISPTPYLLNPTRLAPCSCLTEEHSNLPRNNRHPQKRRHTAERQRQNPPRLKPARQRRRTDVRPP